LPKVRVEDLQHVEIEIRSDVLKLALAELYANKHDGAIRAPDGDARIGLTLGLPDRCHRHRLDWVKVAVNGRIVRSPELEQTIVSSLARTLPRDRYPVCFLHIQIPPHYIDWNRHPAKVEIYLQHVEYWQSQVDLAIERALNLQAEESDESTHTQPDR
jgi:DNA mismatch repair protein MutL